MAKQLRISLVHWFPLEFYPPATNLLECFAARPELETFAFTSNYSRGRTPYANSNVEVLRYGFPDGACGWLVRLWRYFFFPFAVVVRLIRLRPDCVLYYEPQSSLPALIYAATNRRCRIFIHHHEYHEPQQFLRPGMRLVRFYHWLEKRFLFKRAVWISHTNEQRLKLFHEDHPNIDPAKLKVVGNFPPASWKKESLVARGERREDKQESKQLVASGERLDGIDDEHAKALRLVYVGSVSLHDTFIGPLVEWILSRGDDAVTLDVFAYNADEKTKVFLREASGERREAEERRGNRPQENSAVDAETDSLAASSSQLASHVFHSRVRYFEAGVDYDDLPKVLADYDVGVILYRCNTTNYKFNASNKLFEYLACGLEVWYPPQMQGVKPYARDDMFPRVLEVDFERLDKLDLDRMANANGLPDAPPPPCCEDEFGKLMDEFKKLGARS